MNLNSDKCIFGTFSLYNPILYDLKYCKTCVSYLVWVWKIISIQLMIFRQNCKSTLYCLPTSTWKIKILWFFLEARFESVWNDTYSTDWNWRGGLTWDMISFLFKLKMNLSIELVGRSTTPMDVRLRVMWIFYLFFIAPRRRSNIGV